MSAQQFPHIERACMIEVPRPRNGRPSYAWVQGWQVRYSPTRVSMPLRRYDAFNLLAQARKEGT